MKAKQVLPALVIAALFCAALLLTLRDSKPEPAWNGKPVSAWIQRLHFFDGPNSECTAEAAILHIGPPAIPYLIRDLQKKDTRLSRLWLSFYPKLPTSMSRRFLPPIPRHELRYHAAHGLELLGPASTNALPWLVEALDDKDKWVRIGAVSGLGALGPSARKVSPRLVAGLADGDSNYRLACLIALKRMYRGSDEMDPVFIRLLGDSDWNFRAHAAEALGSGSGQSPEVIKALLSALQDPHQTVIDRASIALGRKAEAAGASVPALLQALKRAETDSANGSSAVVMWKILEALGDIGPAAESAIPVLTNLLESRISVVGTLSAIAWGKIAPNDPVPIAYLTDKLETGDDSDRFWATWALGQRGAAARSALPAFDTLTTKYPERRDLQIMLAAASWRIDRSRPNPTRRILELAPGGFKPNRDYEVIRLLGELGPAAREAVPAVLEAYKSSGGPMLREYARDALLKIDPAAAENPWR